MAVGLYSGVSGLALGVGLYKGNSGLWGGASGLINGFGGSGPFPGASLYLDFLTPPLDSRITFSRGSNATRVDATGKITYAPANLLLYSQSLATSPWENGIAGTGVAPTVTDNAGVAPDGTTTATRLQLSLGGGTSATDLSRRRQPATVQAVSHIFSVWIRSTDGTSSYNIHLQDAINATRNITVTGTWTRYDVSAVSPGTLSYLSVGLRGGQAPANSNTADILVWGAQLEPVTYQTTPSTYVATTASAYYGPRFDYDPVTLAPKGLLIEEARTNLALYSQDFTNAAWTKNNSTVTANVTNAPNGTTTAFKVAEDATTAFHGISQLATLVLGTANTQTFFVKAAERSWVALTEGNNVTATAYFNLATGTVGTVSGTGSPSASIVPFGNGWYRISLTFTPIANSGNIQIRTATADGVSTYAGTAGSGIYMWGAQLEAGSFATSYIPTVASTVTRSADVATMTGTNFSSWFNPVEGTLITNFVPTNSIANNTRAAAISDGVNRIVDIYIDTTVWRSFNGTTNVTPASSTAVLNSTVNFASAYKSGDYAAAMNGSAVGTAATAGVQSANKLNIGSNIANSNQLNGHIRSIAYYNTRLPNAQLQTLTAPSLATTLSLSFTNQAYTVGV